MPGGDLPGPGISALTSAAPRESSTTGVTVIPTDSPAPLGRERLPERFRGPLQQPQPLNVLLPGREGRDRGGGGWMGAGPREAGALNSSRSDLQQWSGRCTAAFPGLDIGEPLGQPVLAAEPGSPLRVGQVDPEFWKAGWRETRDNSLGQRWKGSRRLTTDAVGDHDDRHQPLAWKGWAARVGGFPPTAMSTGNDTGWGSSVGEEAWAGTGVEVEESALPTFSTAAKVRVGVTAALFLSSAAGNLAVLWSVTRPRSSRLRPSPVRRLFGHLAAADLLVTFVVMPLDAAWNATVQWLAGDVACRILMFLKLLAMYAAAFLPVVIGLDRQAAVLHPLGPRGGGRKLLGTAWGLSFLLALPQVSDQRSPGINLPRELAEKISYRLFAPQLLFTHNLHKIDTQSCPAHLLKVYQLKSVYHFSLTFA
ncbi:uncharacterized protein LOC127559163 [Antechinus flavipes]|uniref:uncharacterized protein LOC127559163 n=1 Tax=Antechinus flavipes TaxID=38775 RepID=UPI002235E293|nr:uncharacterized protein LOC127559163 [Antechinus flavipes]